MPAPGCRWHETDQQMRTLSNTHSLPILLKSVNQSVCFYKSKTYRRQHIIFVSICVMVVKDNTVSFSRFILSIWKAKRRETERRELPSGEVAAKAKIHKHKFYIGLPLRWLGPKQLDSSLFFFPKSIGRELRQKQST